MRIRNGWYYIASDVLVKIYKCQKNSMCDYFWTTVYGRFGVTKEFVIESLTESNYIYLKDSKDIE